jgi:hypothetical protein
MGMMMHCLPAINRPAGWRSTRQATSTSAISAAMPPWRAACSARRSASRAGFILQPPDCNPCNDQFARRRQQRRQRPRVDLAKDTLGLFEGADQQRTPSLNIACMSRIQAIPVRFERRPRFVEGLRRPAEIARYEREFGLGDDAPRTRHRLSRTEHARGFLERGFSRTRSSSCAIAMPRSARAGGSSRNPTRFKAPNASPDAKASAAAVINASIAAP